ncbi:hypothetical protein [Solimonas variicoloris]|uniref:hypothetical protein n=1 Tax=Solimonas variicoloris TaxID=254408 RepID=UPI0012B5688F|nr:hypothetical protein [Solimonas variicoloris]
MRIVSTFVRWSGCCVLAMLLACGGGAGGDGSDAGGEAGGGSGGTDGPPAIVGGDGDQYGSDPDPIPAPSGAPGSNALIDAALAKGDLNTEQALFYRMYAQFDDVRLPAAYRGDDVGQIEGHAHDAFVAQVDSVGLDRISDETKSAMLPYFLPPYYSGSWWAERHAAGKALSSGRAKADSCPGCSPLSSWKNVSGNKVVVWYQADQEATDRPKANILLAEFEQAIWPKLTTTMGRTPLSDEGTGGVAGSLWTETDGRLDVALVDLANGNEGLTTPSTWRCKATSVHIALNRSLSNQGLIAQAAHEFMHAIQYAMSPARCVDDYYTTKEATAVWATNHVYAKNNWEHGYVKHYLSGGYVSDSYDSRSTPGLFRYGAYVFPLFLESLHGAGIVKSIWDQTATYNSELSAIDAALVDAGASFALDWPKFIAANWNSDGLTGYLAADGIASKMQIEAGNSADLRMNGSGTSVINHTVDIPHAAAVYYRVAFPDSAARSITIFNGWTFKATVKTAPDFGESLYYTGLSALERRGLSMQVYLKINGSWQAAPAPGVAATADLSNRFWAAFCRDNPAAKVDEMIVMYGNAETGEGAPNYGPTSSRDLLPGVLATSIGCRDWVGTLNMSFSGLDGTTQKLEIANARLENTMDTSAPGPGSYWPDYPLQPGEEGPQLPGWVYRVASGDASWEYYVPPDGAGKPACSGQRNLGIGGNLPSVTMMHMVPAGTASRRFLLPGFLVNVLAANASAGTVLQACGLSPHNLDITVGTPGDPKIAASGLSAQGDAAQVNNDHVTGIWTLQGLTQ